MILKSIAGDYFGDIEIQVDTLWHGPDADKFKGLHFIDEGINYEPEDLKHLVYLSDEDINSFLDDSILRNANELALDDTAVSASDFSVGNKTILRLGIEFNDGRKIIMIATDNRILQCLLLFAKAKGIIE